MIISIQIDILKIMNKKTPEIKFQEFKFNQK